jgi:two-component system NtrC family sensor kinase
MAVVAGARAAALLEAHGIVVADLCGLVKEPIAVVTSADALPPGWASLVLMPPGAALPAIEHDAPLELVFLPTGVEELKRRLAWLEARGRQAAPEGSPGLQRLAAAGRVAAGVSHELRNCLGYARVNLGFVADTIRRMRSANADLRAALADALEGLQHAEGVTTTVLDLVRGESPSTGPIELNEVVARAMRVVAPALPRGVRLITQLDPCPRAWGNAGAIVQVLTNLVLNAAQACAPRGRVRVQTRREGDAVQLCVSDSGPGIPPEIRERLFTPFTTARRGGIGLGLALSRDLIVACGGTLTIGEGALGGAEFTVSLRGMEHADRELAG